MIKSAVHFITAQGFEFDYVGVIFGLNLAFDA